MATEELDDRPAFPSARHERALRGVVAELIRHQRRKRGKLDFADRALHERTKREIVRAGLTTKDAPSEDEASV